MKKKDIIENLVLIIIFVLAFYCLNGYLKKREIENFNKLQQMELDSYHTNIANEINQLIE